MNELSLNSKPSGTVTTSQRLFHTRIGISSFYLVAGLIFASWASRIPDIKVLLNLTDGDLGKILFAIPTGQLMMMFLSGYLVNKFGSRITLLISITMYALVLVFISFSNNFGTIFLVLFFFGTAANMINIALNTQACGLEALYNRNIMSSFHGLWSLGGLSGGIIGAIFVHAGQSILTHYTFIAIVCFILVAIGSRHLITNESTLKNNCEKNSKSLSKLDLPIILLGLIGFGGMFCEGTMFDWSSVYFATIVKPDESLVRLGYIAGMGTMTIGRFIADRFVSRYQAPTVLKFCGLLIISGLLLTVAFPYLITSTLGFMLVGLGISSIVPICYSVAGKSSSYSASIAITIVSSISFLGFMIGPPLIGLLSEATNLRIALAIASSFGLLIIIFADKYQSIKTEKYENRTLGNLGR
ncbi:MAG: MFS transporter [Tannerella sp.]|jgi:MFS family permease|nr:MFS transporter [Tannerella sp.]